jgi:glycine C-acetyltransferase
MSGKEPAAVKGADIPARLASLLKKARSDQAGARRRTLLARDGIQGSYYGWDGRVAAGLDFTVADYLGLSQDERVLAAAHRAVATFGTHAGSGGCIALTAELAEALGALLGGLPCQIFPAGWAAAHAALRALVGRHDHILLDLQTSAGLRDGAQACGATVTPIFPRNVGDLSAKLSALRAADRDGAIVIALAAFQPIDSDGPALADITGLARRHSAYVLLDCAYDLGVFGPAGAGLAAEAGILTEIDFIVGTFGNAFAAPGGYFASRWSQCLLAVQAEGQRSGLGNRMSPVLAAAAQRALLIAASPEGDALRVAVLRASQRLRQELAKHGFACPGRPSPLVSIPIASPARGRQIVRDLAAGGRIVDTIEHSGAGSGASRLLLQLTPAHGALDLDTVAADIAAVATPGEGGLTTL